MPTENTEVEALAIVDHWHERLIYGACHRHGKPVVSFVETATLR